MPVVSADTAAERSSNLKRGKTVLFPGTPGEMEVETAVHEVHPGGSAKYVASEVANIGCDDALAARARAHGQPPYVPIAKRVADKIAKGQHVPHAQDGVVTLPAPPAGVPVVAAPPAPGSAAELAAQIAPFEGNPKMQDIVTAEWRKRRDSIAAQELAAAERMSGKGSAEVAP